MKIVPAGEGALIAYFGDQPSPDISLTIQAAVQRLPDLIGPALVDLVPSYASLLVLFDPLEAELAQVRQAMLKCGSRPDAAAEIESRLVELPTWYSPESGPDLSDLASHAGLSVEQVIELHQQQEYRVYAIGFAPGFAYLGEVDPQIARPRHKTPRQKVPAGSVAIADRQTAVYPQDSPGGWNLIGRCPLTLFDPEADPVMPFEVGDRVRFRAISRSEFERLGGNLER